jgi:predicted porin
MFTAHETCSREGGQVNAPDRLKPIKKGDRMKKSLIAVAVAGLFTAPVAMAEVTLSGAINLGIEIAKSSSAGTAPSLTRTLLNSNYSHVDIESVDDIGGGNKVIFHYQLIAAPQNTGQSSANPLNRNSFLGIAGGWGAFKMGTNENVYERMMYTADPLDGALGPGGNLMILGTPGANAAFQAGQATAGPNNGQVDFYRRTDQTIWYESPNFSGFSFEIDRTLSAYKTAGTGAIDPTVTSIGGKFQPEGAPFYVDLSYEQHKDMFGLAALAAQVGIPGSVFTKSKDTGIQLGGGYMIGDLGLNLRYEQLKYQADNIGGGSDDYKRNAIWFGVKYNLPSGYVGAEVGEAADGKLDGQKIDKTGATMFGIGYFHNLSKQSQLQFIYATTQNKDNASYTQGGAPGTGLGQDHQVFHVGIKHTY